MRTKINNEIETQLLVSCRRRCSLCYGLNRDISIKAGQIAHINQNSSDNRLENLVFLCLQHHDQYDSRTSQSKNITARELNFYKTELEEAVKAQWKKPIEFDNIPVLDLNEIAGRYVWESENASAEIEITAKGGNKVLINGIAFWGTQNEYGPNIGELDFESTIDNNQIHYSDGATGFKLVINCDDDKIRVTEQKSFGQFGMNVSFEGIYKNVTREIQYNEPQDNLIVKVENGNIYVLQEGKEVQITFLGMDIHPLQLSSGNLVFIRAEEFNGFTWASDEMVLLRRLKVVRIDIETTFENIITDCKPYEDGLFGTHDIMSISNPTLSLDEQFIYFVTEKWTTGNQLVKVDLTTGTWTELFTAEAFELIKFGKYQNLFLIAFSDLRGKGRDIYYKLCDESGKQLKEFDSETTLLKFRDLHILPEDESQ